MPTKNTSRVTVHSMLTVVSSSPVEPGHTHRLTPSDHYMALHTFHVVSYYRPSRAAPGPFAWNKLRPSLSEALSLCPVIAGRLTRTERNGSGGGERWEVKCNDAGVRVLRATVGATLDEWLRSADGDEERDLTAWEDMPEDPSIWPPFRIQVLPVSGFYIYPQLIVLQLNITPHFSIEETEKKKEEKPPGLNAMPRISRMLGASASITRFHQSRDFTLATDHNLIMGALNRKCCKRWVEELNGHDSQSISCPMVSLEGSSFGKGLGPFVLNHGRLSPAL